MIMAILIILIVAVLVFCAAVAYIVSKIKYIHIQLTDDIDLSKVKIINAISKLLKRDMSMEIPDVEVNTDESIARREAEKIYAAKKGLRSKD